ncbi:monovalent cation/H+ antiporter subunit D [Pseudoxanthomonas putridarboris]|uniref:Monovalent cation/H+ antiporter subunit D n=1 Tax=Pseudoxanthomonas putridarboris TaxID=752605 RepID=A0ABU9IV00_9GAMM
MTHLPVLPILVPLFAGALALLLERRGIRTQRAIAALGTVALLGVVGLLLYRVSGGEVAVYLLGDWPARLGIAVVADRLSVLMLVAGNLLAVACLLYACAGWDKRAPHFHALFQFQLMGLNGAFLTGDVFNLFVFFEVMLIASYGLLLSGGRDERMRAGLHYVAFNIAASTLFLIALGLIYGLLGTLNMAELALRIGQLPPDSARLVQAAGGLLLVVFCAKAALLPMYFWLPDTYTRAPAAVAALFAIMTKVGLYAVLRVGTLLFGAQAGALAGFAWDGLLYLGLATLLLAAFGVLAAVRLRTLVAYLILVSAATLFIAFSLDSEKAIGAGLYYLVHSSLVGAALFLIADLVCRRRGASGDRMDLIAPMPEKTALGLLFLVAAVSVAGLPPLSGFLGKASLMQAVPEGRVALVWSVLLLSSLMVLVGLARAGSRIFWRVDDVSELAPAPIRRIEYGAVTVLLALGVGMAVKAQPVMAYAQAAARQLMAPVDAIDHIRGTAPQKRSPSP